MMKHREADLPARELLTAFANNLHQRFFETSRLDAKQLFIAIQGGREIPFMEIRLPAIEDSVHCLLALDDSRYVGKLNFSRFREALRAHLGRIATRLNDPKAVPNVMMSPAGDSSVFNEPGIVEHEGQINILVSGMLQSQPGQILLRLLFIDPAVLEQAES